MWSMLLGISLFSFNIASGNGYYYGEYNGTITSDVFIDRDTDLAIAKVISEKYGGFHPTFLTRSTGPAVIYEHENITENIKILCAENKARFSWEWVNADSLRSSGENLSDLVEGGSNSFGYVYIAKMYIRGNWYLGEVDGTDCYFYGVPDCYHIITGNQWCQTPDCMVLKYK